MPEAWAGLLLTGFVAGVASGLFGIGGGVVIVPVLIVFLHFTAPEAISTSLAALLLPVSILGVLTYYRAKLIDIRAALIIALGLTLTNAFGALLTLWLDDINPDLMKQLYGVFLLYMSWRFVEPRRLYRWYVQERFTQAVDSGQQPAPVLPHIRWPVLFGIGLFAGFLAGLFGIGGGVVIVPILALGLGYDQKRAVATSLAALTLPIGLPGVLVYQQDGVLQAEVAAFVALGILVGAILGANIALNLSSEAMRRWYGVFLLFAALRFIFG